MIQPILRFVMSPVARGMLNAGVLSRFRPSALFRAGQQGVWYDPSDLSTLFQDAAGTIPVTGTEQPVGLMLDKSKGLVLGPEKFSPVFPYTSTVGWAPSNGATLSEVGGFIRITSTTAGYGAAAVTIYGFTVGKSYVMGVQIGATTANCSVQVSGGVGTVLPVAIRGAGTYRCQFVATATAHIFTFLDNGDIGTYAEFGLVSVKLLPGNHASQRTASKRPILQESGGLYSLKFDGVDDFMSTAAIDFSGTDKLSAWVGVTKLNDTARIVAELSANTLGNSGSFYLVSGTDAGYSQAYTSLSRGTYPDTPGQIAGYAGVPAPDTAALTITHDISGDLSTIKRNGVAGVNGTFNKGDGNFGNHPLYIASRAGNSTFFSGNLYQLVIAGALYDANTVAKMNAWTAQKAGVTL